MSRTAHHTQRFRTATLSLHRRCDPADYHAEQERRIRLRYAPDPEAAEYDGPEHACEPCRCDDPACCGPDEAARANLSTEAYVSGLRRSLDALPSLLPRWDFLDDDLRDHYEDEIAWMARTLRGWVERARAEGRPDLAREIVLLSDRWRELGDATDEVMGWPVIAQAEPAWHGPVWDLTRRGRPPLGALLGMIARVAKC